jgi:hypothetical protein
MAERRSDRQRKPVVPFDEIVHQSAKPAKPRKPRTKVPKAREPHYDPASAEPSNKEVIQGDPVLLCEQTQGLNLRANSTENSPSKAVEEAVEEAVNLEDLKAKRKAKAEEIAGLKKLQFEEILKKIPKASDVVFEPFSPGRTRDPKVAIPNIDAADLLSLLNLFIPPTIYTIIVENTNLYAIVWGVDIAPTSTNSRYWWPTNADEIRVLFSIFYYIEVHKKPQYPIY